MKTMLLTTKTTGLALMSNFDIKKLREQVIQTGQVLRKEFKGSDNQLEAQANWTSDASLQERRIQALRENSWKQSDKMSKIWQSEGFKEKRKQSLDQANQRPEVKLTRSKAIKGVYDNPEYRAKQKARSQETSQDPEFQKRNREAYLKAKEDPQYWENYYKGIDKREEDKTYHTNRIKKANAVICRKVHTPLGEFDSITLASKAHGMTNTETMRNRIKSPNFPEYYHLDNNVRPKKK